MSSCAIDCPMANIDHKVVSDFAAQWSTFDQTHLRLRESREIFDSYFHIFPWHQLPAGATGFDLGCGSGRWARLAADRVNTLYCIDPSGAIAVAKKNLEGYPNCRLIQASADAIPLRDGSLDFGYAIGVLHHVPDTQAAIRACAAKLKPGAPLLLYLYYAFDNKPLWFKSIWYVADFLRRMISTFPKRSKYWVTGIVAFFIYYPCARAALLVERFGGNVSNVPLAQYRNRSLYVMRTDAYDRFSTRLEHRFTREQITAMLRASGLRDIQFSERPPYWCVLAYKNNSTM